MSNELVITIAIKLIFGLISALASLLLWSKTRDSAWLFMVLGVVSLYLETLLDILDKFGFIITTTFKFGDVDLIPFIFSVIPFLFFTSGLIIFLFRIRKH